MTLAIVTTFTFLKIVVDRETRNQKVIPQMIREAKKEAANENGIMEEESNGIMLNGRNVVKECKQNWIVQYERE